MRKQGCVVLSIIISSLLLSGCLSDIWTGTSLIYDRHNMYKKINDFQLGASANRALYYDTVLKQDGCNIDVAVLHGDVLVVGRVPTLALRQEAYARLAAVPDKRRLIKQLQVSRSPEDVARDGWITASIRSKIFANSDIDPHAFKVVTFGRIVYLMGDVIPEQAAQVILFARQCTGVKRVVKLFKYYNLSDHPTK